MPHEIREADWRLFRQLRPIALERFCQRVLDEVDHLAADAEKSAHERYLEIFRQIRLRDRELAEVFDDPRRSTAFQQLSSLRSHGLLTRDELDRFSHEAHEVLQLFLGP